MFDQNIPIVELTEGAIEKVREYLQGGNYAGVRLTVHRKSGEFVYHFDYVEKGKADPKDSTVGCGDYIFFIQYESVSVVRGAVIDYFQTGLTQAWVIDNPNSAWDSELAREYSYF